MLINNIALPQKYRPHKLIGDHYPKWECHIEPDWLLI
ncbi:type II toxin-antitoxin system mRNA interferase toxin, RelE/StbE family [Rickettsia helvetica]|nr:type II toxin-antitoxin system mRNA interferase toxin, RelE/StbE family [Rickettsia helvetica]MCZ6883867.1 type II toxin-antitoxin system mRNA interferase toxin, RelE/StbE family [Rickettsia endosymbiont of Ixodes ricinus]MCZ6897064.1 type II toxin-antitoxin system mRNA interferase toxin, RelE/StbE family [Rickettsia endosymbiont of Ixodes ricinus]